jgi:glyoxylase-like metal-dependent hydrolase (beta-lactamase superfamily II)
MRVISTPGHTPGHCSLLVRLAKTGPILLSGDVAHYQFNMEHHLVPSTNSDPEQSRRPMERVDTIVRDEGAQLWLNHDLDNPARSGVFWLKELPTRETRPSCVGSTIRLRMVVETVSGEQQEAKVDASCREFKGLWRGAAS